MPTFGAIAAFVAVVAVCAVLVIFGTSRSERAECLTWQKQATQYTTYYITHWQAEQCMSYGITIDAPIK